MIAKGCTCKNSFRFPYDKVDVSALFVTYQQNGMTVLEKQLPDCTIEDGKVSVNLSQEETLSFEDNEVIEIQIRARLNNGIATKSDIIKTYTDRVLKGDVI